MGDIRGSGPDDSSHRLLVGQVRAHAGDADLRGDQGPALDLPVTFDIKFLAGSLSSRCSVVCLPTTTLDQVFSAPSDSHFKTKHGANK